MTPAQLEAFLAETKHLTAVQRAEAFGIDLSLLDENLRLSHIQRLRQHDIALNHAEALQAALTQTRASSRADHLPPC